MSNQSLSELAVNTIRTLSMDAVQAAGCGHPGMPMGMADAAYVLWTKFMKHDPSNPDWYDRDRFVLSAGHGSMLLYSLLHLTGYDVDLDELKNFRQWGSITPGHPEYGLTPGVETTTGPLGQGFGTGVGMAIAEAHLAATFNTADHTLTDHYTYAIVSDGDLMEGISHEAASLAGHLKLGKLIYLYDANQISIEGSTDLAFTEDVAERFRGYDWDVQKIDGHDRDAVEKAIKKAQSVTDQPSIIICRTHIGFGSPNQQDTADAHGSALGVEEVRLTKENLGWDPDKQFFIPDEVLSHFREAKEEGAKRYGQWQKKLKAYEDASPGKAKQFKGYLDRRICDKLDEVLPQFESSDKGMATRAASGKVLNAIAKVQENLLGGSADLAPSTKTLLDGSPAFTADSFSGRNFHFGVREHAMGAAVNGMALHGGLIPYGASFLIFSDYCRPAIRIGALSHIPSIFVFTHDSVGLGEDGPTHQPIEQLASLRAMPNLTVLRPCDANEAAWAWKVAIENADGPTLLVLTRQSVPTFTRDDANDASNLMKGAYILSDSKKETPDVILMGTGSEVQIVMEAQKKLKEEGIDARVVSMPSWELFEQQEQSYREQVLPSEVKARVSIEAGSTFGWKQWVGTDGIAIGIDHFGASAPYEKLYEEFGLTTSHVIKAVKKLV